MPPKFSPTAPIVLKHDELLLILKIRSAPKYVDILVEKRPTGESPDGELKRIVVTESYLFHDMHLPDQI